MNSKKLIIIAAIILTHATLSSAASYTYDVIYNPDKTFTLAGGTWGANIKVGDTVTLDVQAENGYSFSAASSQLWAPLGFLEAANRYANYADETLYNGAIVNSWTHTNYGTSSIHLGDFAQSPATIFNEFIWTATLLSSSSTTNTTSNILNGNKTPGYAGSVWDYGSAPALVADARSHLQNNIPEPSVISLIVPVLAAMGYARRRHSVPA